MSSAALRLAEVVSALSQALDLGSNSSSWHSVRSCILGMRIAHELKLAEDVQNDLYYALLLKDAGFSAASFRPSNALAPEPEKARAAALRCERGGALARIIGLSEQTAVGISRRDEHWSGLGETVGLSAPTIPLLSRIVLLAQTLDWFFTHSGPETALQATLRKSGTWFDPELVRAARSLAGRGQLWRDLTESDLAKGDLARIALALEPRPRTMDEGHVTLDAVCQAFAIIVDAKSPFTYNHSNGVANAAVAMAGQLGLERSRILFVRHAALLHDLGKMAIPNSILQKAGSLDHAEWLVMRSHPEHTWRILRSIRGFEEMSEVAASHHERLDGCGYFRGLSDQQLSIEARIVSVADIFDALSAERPYRDAMPLHKAFEIIRKNSLEAFDPLCIEALEQSGVGSDQSFRDVQALQKHLAEVTPAAPLSKQTAVSK